MICLTIGAAALAWSGTPTLANIIGPVAIIGACIMWGLDNNLTRKVSLADPLQIAELKGLIAGPDFGPGAHCLALLMPYSPVSSVFLATA